MQAVAEFWIYAIVFLVIAFALCLRAMVQATEIIVKKLLGPFGFVGDVLGDGFGSVASAITGALDVVIHDLERFVGWSLHVQAQLIRWMADYLAYGASVVLHLGQHVTGKAAFSDLTRLHRFVLSALKAISHATAAALHDSVVINKRADLALRHAVLPRLRALEHEAEVVLPHDIAGLRHRARTLENEYAKLNHWLRTHPWTAVTKAFVGAVAIALGKLGLDWIKCDSAKSFFRKHGCNGWNLLDDLLAAVAVGLVVDNICNVIPLLEEAFGAVAAPLIVTLTGIAAGLCAAGSGPPETLPPPGLQLTPSPGYSLYLP